MSYCLLSAVCCLLFALCSNLHLFLYMLRVLAILGSHTCHSLCIHLSLTMYSPVTHYVFTCHSPFAVLAAQVLVLGLPAVKSTPVSRLWGFEEGVEKKAR